MYVLIVRDEFSAAHRLPASGSKCERLHGHNWKVEVEVSAEQLDATGMAIDFSELKAMTAEILEELDHRLLNDLPPFRQQNPTAENLARYIYERVAERIAEGEVKLDRVRVWESETTAASYRRTSSGCNASR
jgi:6-pyruvoyltetrahydropterin/6-carboxytetrahydropterin synthase